MKYLLVSLLTLLLPCLPMSAQELPRENLIASIQESPTPLDSAPQESVDPNQVLELTVGELYGILGNVANQAVDYAVQQTVAEYKPKLDAALLDLKNAEAEKWKYGGIGVAVGAGIVAVLVLAKGFVK